MAKAFKVGDRIRKLSGEKVLIVTSSGDYWTYAQYENSGHSVRDYTGNFTLVDASSASKVSLYKLLTYKDAAGQDIFASYCGTDSSGNWLMERADGAGIVVVKKELCEEVLPYTFSARMSGRDHHFVIEEGKVKKGDVLLYTPGINDMAIVVVKNLDTKNKQARPWKGRRLVTEEL